MKLKNYLQAFMILLVMGSCNSKNNPENNTESKTGLTPAVLKADTTIAPVADAAAEDEGETGCVRGEAEPVLKKSVFPKAEFKRNPDKISATEKTTLKNGDQLTIENTGCESYVLAFTFETSRYQGDTTDAYLWAEHAAALLQEVVPGVDAPIDVPAGTKKLQEFLKQTVRYTFGEEIDFGGEDIRSYLMIEKATQLSDKKYSLKVSFVTGPL